MKMKITKNKIIFKERNALVYKILIRVFLISVVAIFFSEIQMVRALPVCDCNIDIHCGASACSVPAVPSLSCTVTNETTLMPNWSSSPLSSYYNLVGVTGSSLDIDTTNLYYSHSGLNPGTTYTYKVKGLNNSCLVCGAGLCSISGSFSNLCVSGSIDGSYSSTVGNTTSFISPTGLNATCGTTDANLTWSDNSSAETGYKVEESSIVIATTAANVGVYNHTGLVENTTYTYRVRAYHSSGAYSSYSATDSCTTGVIAPNTFTATSSATSTIQINLTWNDRSSVEDGYKIERATGACAGFAQIGTVGAGVESYSDSGLLHGTTYCYRVRAYDGAVNSAYSATDSDTTIMPAPTNLSGVAISQTQINLVWSDNSNSETGFKIERADNSDCSGTPSFSQIGTTGSGITSYSNTGLTSNTSYCYRVRSYTSYTDSVYSSTIAVSTSLPSPTNLTATVSATSTTQINLTWTDNSDNEDEFRLERKTGSSGTYTQIVSVATNTTAYANTGVSDGTIYYYRARACNAVACSSYSNEASVTTVLVAPTNLICTPISSSQINLSWTDNSTSETGFKIERDISSPPSTVIFTTGQNAVAYSDENLSENTLYYYRVRAYNSASGVYSGYTSICSTSTPIYVPTGNLTSSIFDTGSTNGVAFNSIVWKGTQPSDSHVLFQFASNSTTTSFNFIGPNGTSATYYQASGANMAMNISTRYHNNHRYFRYKVYIYPNLSNQSPQITDIIIGYSP